MVCIKVVHTQVYDALLMADLQVAFMRNYLIDRIHSVKQKRDAYYLKDKSAGKCQILVANIGNKIQQPDPLYQFAIGVLSVNSLRLISLLGLGSRWFGRARLGLRRAYKLSFGF